VLADAENLAVLKAAQQAYEEGIATPILLGNIKKINKLIEDNLLDLSGIEIIDPHHPANEQEEEKLDVYGNLFFEKRQRKGFNRAEARDILSRRNYYGAMMVDTGAADAMIGGMSRSYPDTIRPALQTIGSQEGVKKVSGMYILMTKTGPLFLADTTVNFEPSIDDIVEIAELAAKQVEKFNIKPRIALLTYSNFGSAEGTDPFKMKAATAILKQKHPQMIVDGEMQAHLPFDLELMRENHPFSSLVQGGANTLIFPSLSASNIAYNLVKEIAKIEKIGPILMGLRKPIHVLQLGSTTREIVNMIAIAVVDAQKA
jgi:malate dehydrogenase (oxaloacetate-decarboxylating)(NADP+)